MTPVEAAKLVAMLMAAYPFAELPEGTVAVYEGFLQDFDRDRGVAAVRTVIRTHKFFPTIAEIVTSYEGQLATDEVPYHRRFRAPRERPRMRPREVQEAIGLALKALDPTPPPKPEEPKP